jgi:hypothetical protein
MIKHPKKRLEKQISYTYTVENETDIANEVAISSFFHSDSRYFLPILSCKKVEMSTYLLVKRIDTSHSTSFQDFFYRNLQGIHPKKHFLNIIDLFTHLLNAVKMLNTFSLVCLDFHPKNMSILQEVDDRIRPQFTRLDTLFRFSTERKKIPFNLFLPIEAQTIHYMAERGCTTLSFEYVSDIVDIFSKGIASLSLFEIDFIEELKDAATYYLSRFINEPRVDDLFIKTCGRWNMYGLSIFFLVFLRDCADLKSQIGEPTFLCKLYLLLKQIIRVGGVVNVDQTNHSFYEIVYSISREEWTRLFVARADFIASARQPF